MSDATAVGDPAAMRALAAELMGRADALSAAPAGVTAALEAATFEGGAAVRLRGRSSATRGQVAAAAAELRGIAAALSADAATVERLNAEAAEDAEDPDADEGAEA